MSENRKIVINETFFSSTGGANKTKKNKTSQDKPKPKPVIKPNSLKKTLLEKIKKHQQHEKISKDVTSIKKNDIGIENKEDGFHDSFMNSLEYLNKLSEKNKQIKKDKRQKNRTIKSRVPTENKPMTSIQGPNEPLVSVELPVDFDIPYYSTVASSSTISNKLHGGGVNSMNYEFQHIPQPMYQPMHQPMPQPMPQPMYQPMPQPMYQPMPQPMPQPNISPIQTFSIKPDTPYGCLKGGSKPTYREYHNKTLKKNPIVIQRNSNSNSNSNNNHLTHRQQKLSDLKKSYKKIRQKKRTIRKSTYRLGKVGGKVSILIKNNNTRRKVKREHGLLQQKPIIEVKKHLYDKNLIKIGTTAPNDVLRMLYEQSILAGDVTNVANDIQIHNFVNKQ